MRAHARAQLGSAGVISALRVHSIALHCTALRCIAFFFFPTTRVGRSCDFYFVFPLRCRSCQTLPPFSFLTASRPRPIAPAAGEGEGGRGGDPEATGGAAGLGLGPDAQAEEVLGREEVKDYLKGVKVCL